jgi:hypothetical protein
MSKPAIKSARKLQVFCIIGRPRQIAWLGTRANWIPNRRSLVRPVVLVGAEPMGGAIGVNGRRSRSRATARRAAIEAVAASWTIVSEDDGPSSLGLRDR